LNFDLLRGIGSFTSGSTQGNPFALRSLDKVKKVKVAHTGLSSVGFRS